MRMVKRFITGSVVVGLFVAAGSGVAAVNFSRSLASDHSIVAQPAALQSAGDTRDSSHDLVDDRSSRSQAAEPESEPADDSRSKAAASADAASHTSDDSAARPTTRTSDDSAHKSTSQPADDHGSHSDG
jgi:hypothetical protein